MRCNTLSRGHTIHAVQYITRQYGPGHRWLIKALREVARTTERLVAGMSEREVARQPDGDEWCVTEVVGFMRDSEREDLKTITAVIATDGARIEQRRAEYGPLEHDYRSAAVEDFLWDFATMREEMVWTLRTAGEWAWSHVGSHPYRGDVTLEQLVHEVNERDLDTMWRIRRIRDELAPSGRR